MLVDNLVASLPRGFPAAVLTAPGRSCIFKRQISALRHFLSLLPSPSVHPTIVVD